jgi:aerobic-type carbon monoxide dehydrogenase small subunit (CoxS/CutS family)
MKLSLTINDKARELTIEPGDKLLDVLRNAGYMGVKRGCEEGTCGTCVVLVDGVPQLSCLLFAASMEGRAITTIEALDGPKTHPIVEAFVDNGAVQCGYCIPGMVLSTKVLLEQDPSPSEQTIKRALDGHLCRCTGYVKQIEAVQKAAEMMATRKNDDAQLVKEHADEQA